MITKQKSIDVPSNMVQSIKRADYLLSILSRCDHGLNLGELANAANLPKGTTHRLLSSLAHLNYVRQDANRKYHLGFKLVSLGNSLLDTLDLAKMARPFIIDLAERAKETAHLVMLENDEAIYIDKVQFSSEGLHMSSRIGKRAPLHCTSVGKIFLAHMPESEVNRIIKKWGLPEYTPKTITDIKQFKDHLIKVKRDKYALDNEEHTIGVRCTAAPIRDISGKVIAAVSVSAPAARVDKNEAKKRIRPLVMGTALKISQTLGFSN